MGKDFGTTNNALWFTKKLECVISNMLTVSVKCTWMVRVWESKYSNIKRGKQHMVVDEIESLCLWTILFPIKNWLIASRTRIFCVTKTKTVFDEE